MAEKALDVEASLTRIEVIVKSLESGKLSLQENLKLFEEATTLMKAVEKALQDAEKKIQTLIIKDKE
ncbi:MAG: exodeoxyribonuclease VII small subunit [Firmicutes bacterium]|nr:exodeoxyribonuclease VII small subunit [Bacillota bacterium]